MKMINKKLEQVYQNRTKILKEVLEEENIIAQNFKRKFSDLCSRVRTTANLKKMLLQRKSFIDIEEKELKILKEKIKNNNEKI